LVSVTPVFLTLGLAALAFAGLLLLVEIGIRNGDRPGDVRVSAEPWTSGQPDERHPVLIARIENPSASPAPHGAARPAGRQVRHGLHRILVAAPLLPAAPAKIPVPRHLPR
jgi:hypothetical protein